MGQHNVLFGNQKKGCLINQQWFPWLQQRYSHHIVYLCVTIPYREKVITRILVISKYKT